MHARFSSQEALPPSTPVTRKSSPHGAERNFVIGICNQDASSGQCTLSISTTGRVGTLCIDEPGHTARVHRGWFGHNLGQLYEIGVIPMELLKPTLANYSANPFPGLARLREGVSGLSASSFIFILVAIGGQERKCLYVTSDPPTDG